MRLCERAPARYALLMMTARALLAFGFTLAAFAAAAQTPPTNYDVQNMNFDMWCQEQKHYPPSRCDQRLPDDDKEFQAYRQTVEKYELPYLKQREGQEYNRKVLGRDPVDNPTTPSGPPGTGGTIPNPQ